MSTLQKMPFPAVHGLSDHLLVLKLEGVFSSFQGKQKDGRKEEACPSKKGHIFIYLFIYLFIFTKSTC